MIHVETSKDLQFKHFSGEVQIHFKNINKVYLNIDEIMRNIYKSLEDVSLLNFYIYTNDSADKYRYVESVVHRFMRAAYYDSYEIHFIEIE